MSKSTSPAEHPEAVRIAAARKEAIQSNREVLNVPTAAHLYDCTPANVCAAASKEEEAIRVTLTIAGREVKFLDKGWADRRWRARANSGYEDRLRSLRENGTTLSLWGLWLLLGVESTVDGLAVAQEQISDEPPDLELQTSPARA